MNKEQQMKELEKFIKAKHLTTDELQVTLDEIKQVLIKNDNLRKTSTIRVLLALLIFIKMFYKDDILVLVKLAELYEIK